VDRICQVWTPLLANFWQAKARLLGASFSCDPNVVGYLTTNDCRAERRQGGVVAATSGLAAPTGHRISRARNHVSTAGGATLVPVRLRTEFMQIFIARWAWGSGSCHRFRQWSRRISPASWQPSWPYCRSQKGESDIHAVCQYAARDLEVAYRESGISHFPLASYLPSPTAIDPANPRLAEPRHIGRRSRTLDRVDSV
jgi:hypothetical protein